MNFPYFSIDVILCLAQIPQKDSYGFSWMTTDR